MAQCCICDKPLEPYQEYGWPFVFCEKCYIEFAELESDDEDHSTPTQHVEQLKQKHNGTH